MTWGFMGRGALRAVRLHVISIYLFVEDELIQRYDVELCGCRGCNRHHCMSHAKGCEAPDDSVCHPGCSPEKWKDLQASPQKRVRSLGGKRNLPLLGKLGTNRQL